MSWLLLQCLLVQIAAAQSGAEPLRSGSDKAQGMFEGGFREERGPVTCGFPLYQRAEFPGGDDSLRAYIERSFNYPDLPPSDSAVGKLLVQFTINEHGNVEDVQMRKGVHPKIDAEAERLVREMPLWSPGKADGKTVKNSFALPIHVAQRVDKPVHSQAPEMSVDTSKVYAIDELEEHPEFPGGPNAQMEWLMKHMEFCAECDEIVGTIYLGFIVERNGRVSNITVKRGLHAKLDAEAVKVVGEMPPWLPGRIRGVAVRTRMVMPVNFHM